MILRPDEMSNADRYRLLIGTVPLEGLRPVGRLAGNAYARITDVFELQRLG